MCLAKRFHMLNMLSQFKSLAAAFGSGASLVCQQSGHVG